MMNEYIAVDNAINYIENLMQDNKDYIGNFLRDYNFYDLDLYYKQGDELLASDFMKSELFYKNLSNRFPVINTDMDRLLHSSRILHASALLSSTLFTRNYFWKLSEFNKNSFVIKLQKFSESKNAPIGFIVSDDMNHEKIAKLLADKKFNQLNSELLNSKAENQTLKQRIAELEAQLADAAPLDDDDKELTATSQKAVTKLLYALLSEHGYSIDGTTKGVTNDQLAALTSKYKAGVTRQTIASWLSRVNDIKNNQQK